MSCQTIIKYFNLGIMGIRDSTPVDKTEYVTLDTFNQSGRRSRGQIYESRLSSSSSNKQLVHKTMSFTESTETTTRYLSMLQTIGKQVQCSNLYLPALCSVKPSDTVCTDYQILDLYYEHYDVRLKQQIEARRRHNERFSQQQVWYILYSILNGIRMFERFSIASGELKTDKVLLNDKGHLKVFNRLTSPDEYPDNLGVRRFYAPEQLRAMRERIDKKINQNIAETFAVGIIVLELTTFIPGESFYDMQRIMLNDHVLQKADFFLSQNYSKLLYNLTRTMLSGNYDRPLPSQIHTVFRPYQHRILSLRPFNFQPGQNMMNASNASLMSL